MINNIKYNINMEVTLMNKKSFFSQIITLVLVTLICIILTVSVAYLVGSTDADIFDFENLNFSNVIPILIIGAFVSCIVIGFTVLFISRSVFLKFKDYFNETKDKGDGNK